LKEIAEDFNRKWQFPHCLGAVDGKHVQIKKPPGSGSWYSNYKGMFSIVLLAIVNANYEILLADVRTNRRISDGSVIRNTKVYGVPVARKFHEALLAVRTQYRMTHLQLLTFMGKEGCGAFFWNFDIMFWNLSKTSHRRQKGEHYRFSMLLFV